MLIIPGLLFEVLLNLDIGGRGFAYDRKRALEGLYCSETNLEII